MSVHIPKKSLPSIVYCDGKASFESFADANNVIKRTARTPRPGRAAYHCWSCRKWHLGNDTGRVRRRKELAYRNNKRGGNDLE